MKDRKKYLADVKIDTAKSLLLKLGLVSSLISLASCSSMTDVFNQKDLQIAGTKEGLDTYYEGLVGLMMSAKEKDNIPENTPYHKLKSEAIKLRLIQVTKQKAGN